MASGTIAKDHNQQTGKQRAKKEGGARAIKSWRVLLLSTGEVGTAALKLRFGAGLSENKSANCSVIAPASSSNPLHPRNALSILIMPAITIGPASPLHSQRAG